MPIYLVRWPDLSASLVRAETEEHLLDILDQTANPEGCEWEEYDGPLAIDFSLPAEWHLRDERPGQPVAPDQVVVDGVGPMAHEHVAGAMMLSFAEGDDGSDTAQAILARAFPVLQRALREFQASEGAEEQDFIPPEADLRNALHAELTRMLTATWRHAQVERSTDPIVQFAREMDLPVGLARKYAEVALAERHGGDDDDPTTGGEAVPAWMAGRWMAGGDDDDPTTGGES